MAYSNQTTHYGLPLPTGTDKSSWLDANEGFQRIDSALYQAAQDAGSQSGAITQLNTRVSTVEGEVSTIDTNLSSETAARTAGDNSIRSDMGAADNALSARIATLEATATRVVNQINEAFGKIDVALSWRGWSSQYSRDTGETYVAPDTSYYTNYRLGMSDVNINNRYTDKWMHLDMEISIDKAGFETILSTSGIQTGQLYLIPVLVLGGKVFTDGLRSYTQHAAFLTTSADLTALVNNSQMFNMNDTSSTYPTTTFRSGAIYVSYNGTRDETVFWMDCSRNLINNSANSTNNPAAWSFFIDGMKERGDMSIQIAG